MCQPDKKAWTVTQNNQKSITNSNDDFFSLLIKAPNTTSGIILDEKKKDERIVLLNKNVSDLSKRMISELKKKKSFIFKSFRIRRHSGGHQRMDF
jgi:hypothetical protein